MKDRYQVDSLKVTKVLRIEKQALQESPQRTKRSSVRLSKSITAPVRLSVVHNVKGDKTKRSDRFRESKVAQSQVLLVPLASVVKPKEQVLS